MHWRPMNLDRAIAEVRAMEIPRAQGNGAFRHGRAWGAPGGPAKLPCG